MNTKKIILHFINSKIFSGLESVACDIIDNVKEYNHIYVTQDGPVVEILKEKKINYEIITKMSIKEIRRVVKKYDADIIHAHDFTASCLAAFSFINIPIVSHLHHNAPWLRKINFKTIFYLFSSVKFSKIIVVSEAIENEFVFSKLIKRKFLCLFNPISVKKITSMINKSDYEKKYDICCVGRLTEAKNPLRWLDIVKKVSLDYPNLKAIWVGDGELKETILNKINELNLQKNISVVGFKKNPYKFLAASKIYLLTSVWEGFGLSAFEALSLGIPAVVTNVGGLPYIVTEDSGVLCESNEDFILAIKDFMSSERKLIKYQKNAVKQAKKIDNFEEYMSKLTEVYSNVLNK